MIDFSSVKAVTIPEGYVSRILLGGKVLWKKSNFFEDYQRVEWIGVSGNQWIDTGVSPQSDNVVYECEWVETTLEYTKALFGSTNTNYTANRNRWSASHYHPARGTIYSATGTTDQLCRLTGVIVANEKNTLKSTITNGTLVFEVNGQSATGSYAGTIQNGVNITLFGNSQNGTSVSERSQYTRMYRWKMTDNGVVVRNMVPCYRKADGVIGMYDTISQQLFVNAGTGEFSKGSDIFLPSAYQQVEWIGASGTQWIDTGVSPHSDKVIYECEWVETSLERAACLFAATLVNYDNTLGNRFTGNLYHPGTGNLSFSIAKSSDICKYSGIVAGVKNKIAVTILNGTVTRVVNGDSVTEPYVGTIQNGVNIGLFATNRDTTVHEYCKYTRMYRWKMTDNGVVVRNMIPCYRKSDGAIGMYDAISKRFFTNAGTGEFSKGADL